MNKYYRRLAYDVQMVDLNNFKVSPFNLVNTHDEHATVYNNLYSLKGISAKGL